MDATLKTPRFAREPGSYDEKISYGPSASQFVRLYLPENPRVCVVIVHGGFWKSKFGVDNAAIESLAPDLVERGFAAAEVEYRRGDEGGWPQSSDDVAAAVRMLQPRFSIVLLGHSAGGHAALLAAEATKPLLTVAVAPVADLVEAYNRKLSDEGDAVEKFIKGTPTSHPDLYAAASPKLPLTVPCLVVTGEKDIDVPADMTREFYRSIFDAEAKRRAQHGETNNLVTHTLLEIPIADHYSILDARSVFWPYLWSGVLSLLDDC